MLVLKLVLFFSLLSVFVFSQMLNLNPDGSFRLDQIKGQLIVSEKGNKPNVQDEKTVEEKNQVSMAEGIPWELKSHFKTTTFKLILPFTQVASFSKDEITLSYLVENLTEEVLDLRLSFRLTCSVFQGKAIYLDGKAMVLPLEGDTYELVPDTQVTSLLLPGVSQDFLLTSSSGFKLFIQDRRKTKNDYFEIRIQLNRKDTLASLTFGLKAMPVGTYSPVKSNLKSWERFPNFVVKKEVDFLGSDRKEKMDLYLPTLEGDETFPGVLIIHGGGWAIGDKADARERQIATTLASAGFVVASVNYRLASKDAGPSYPTNVHDVKTAIRFLRVHAKEYHLNPDHLGTIGGSAGGHLSMLMAWTGDEPKLDPPLYPGISTKIDAVVDLYGVPDMRLGLSGSKSPSGKGWIGKTPDEEPVLYDLLSPVKLVKKEGAPVYILHGTKDTTVPIEQSEALVKALKEVGANYTYEIVKDAPHTFLIDSKYGDYREKIIEFFKKYLK